MFLFFANPHIYTISENDVDVHVGNASHKGARVDGLAEHYQVKCN